MENSDPRLAAPLPPDLLDLLVDCTVAAVVADLGRDNPLNTEEARRS